MTNLLGDLRTLLDTSGLGMSLEGMVALLLILLTVLLFVAALSRISSENGQAIPLKPLRGYEQLKHAIVEAAETGKTIHLSPGSGTLGTRSTADTLAGVTAVSALAARAATSHVSTVLTTASPVVLPLLQSAAEQAHDKAAASAEYRPSSVRFLSPDPAAYAVGVTDTLQHEKVSTSAVAGALGDEMLLIGERGREANIFQVTGTASVRALPYAITTANDTLVGEDLYAAGAYLGDKPAHVASLLVQDRLRLLMVAAIIVGVVIKTLGW